VNKFLFSSLYFLTRVFILINLSGFTSRRRLIFFRVVLLIHSGLFNIESSFYFLRSLRYVSGNFGILNEIIYKVFIFRNVVEVLVNFRKTWRDFQVLRNFRKM